MFNDIVLSLFDGFRITNPLVICLGGVTNSPGQTDQRVREHREQRHERHWTQQFSKLNMTEESVYLWTI